AGGQLFVAAVAARVGDTEPELVGDDDRGERFVFAAGFKLQPQRIGEAPAPAAASFGRSAFLYEHVRNVGPCGLLRKKLAKMRGRGRRAARGDPPPETRSARG